MCTVYVLYTVHCMYEYAATWLIGLAINQIFIANVQLSQDRSMYDYVGIEIIA